MVKMNTKKLLCINSDFANNTARNARTMGFLNYGNLSADIVVEKEYHDDYYKEDPPPG